MLPGDVALGPNAEHIAQPPIAAPQPDEDMGAASIDQIINAMTEAMAKIGFNLWIPEADTTFKDDDS